MRQPKDEFDILLWVIILGVGAALVAGLIEFNARRQAAAMTRELLRPATPAEQAQMDALIREQEAQNARDLAAYNSALRQATQPRPRYDATPLRDGERCLNHQRFRRIENGWEQVGTCR